MDASLLGGLGVADVITALLAGVVAFFAPCVVPLVPAYMGMLAGVPYSELQDDIERYRARLVASTFAFVAGFTMVFVLLGLSASALGSLFRDSLPLIQQVGGIFVILFGLWFAGVLHLTPLERLMSRVSGKATELLPKQGAGERPAHQTGEASEGGDHSEGNRPRASMSVAALGAPFLVGVVFGTAWTPCVGAVLGTILVLASSSGGAIPGALLLGAFSLGIAVPFLIISLALTQSTALLKRLSPHLGLISRIGGALLVLLGVLLLTGLYERLSSYLASLTVGG